MKKKADIWWGIDGELPLGKCIQNVILFLFFALLAIIVELISDRRNYVFMALCFLPALVSLGSVVKLREGKAIRGLSYILFNGITAGCFAFLFGLMGLEILLFLFQGKERIILLCIAGTGYIFVMVLLGYTVRKLAREKEYNSRTGQAGTVSAALCTLSGMTGVMVGRSFLKEIDQKAALGIVCFICFFVSNLALIGVGNLFKYLYIKKHPEIMDVGNE